MSAALMCDACGSVVTTREERAMKHWFRVERQGLGIEEPGGGLSALFIQPSPMISIDLSGDDDEPLPEIPNDDDPDPVVLHFCKARCLAAWATEASALDPETTDG